MSELDDIADAISTIRHAMQDIIDGNDRLDTEQKTRSAVVQTLDLLARVTEQVRRVDGRGVNGGTVGDPAPASGTISTRTSTRREDDLDGGKPVTLR